MAFTGLTYTIILLLFLHKSTVQKWFNSHALWSLFCIRWGLLFVWGL